MLLTVMLVPWAMQAQDLMDYTFRTGVDTSKWIPLTASATQIFGATTDDVASSVYDMGFNFSFGEDTYSEFSVNSNGSMRLGSTAMGNSSSYGQFGNTGYMPKISGCAKDIGTCTGGYIKYEVIGTAPARILVVEYKMGNTWSSSTIADVMWQVQLHEDSNKVVLVYGSNTPGTTPSAFQTGLAASATDICIINPSTHTLSFHNTAYSSTYSTWHGANRYYEFVRPIITCPKPFNLTFANITPTTADVAWQELGTATDYIVEYDTTGFTRGTGMSVLVTGDTALSLYSLLPNTQYDFYVRSLCAVGDTSMPRLGSFRTACVPYADTLPYMEGFEGYPASSSPTTSYIDPCWKRWSTSTSTTSVYPYVTSTAYQGTRSMYMYATNTYYSVLVMPAFAEEFANLQLSFKMRRATSSYVSPVLVGVMSDPENIATFDTLAVVSCLKTSVWEHFEIPLYNYTDTNKYIAFITPNGSYSQNYIDNITIDVLAPCPVPTLLEVSNITTTTADLAWEDPNGSGWIVEYGLSGFTPGTGTIEEASGTSFNFVDLLPSTGYDVYVRNNCGDDTSNYSLRCSFRTSCSETLVIPFYEGFDSYGFGSGVKPECWITGGYSASYPYVNAGYKYDGIASLYMYSYKASTDTTNPWTYLVSPAIDVTETPIQDLYTSFKMYGTSLSATYPQTVIVGIASDTANIKGTFYPIDTLALTSTSVWEEQEVFFVNYPTDSNGRYIVYVSTPISTTTGSSLYSALYFDDVRIALTPECVRPNEISVLSVGINSITLQWDDIFADHTTWEIVYDSIGFDIDSVDESRIIPNISTDTFTVGGLPVGVFYDFYVRTDCGGEYSNWRGPISAAAGTYSMPAIASDTLSVCELVVYDEGGANGPYPNSANSTLVLYPTSTDSILVISGRYAGESCCDYLKIYDGVGTSGTELCNIVGSNNNIGPFFSTNGPLTIVFTSDASVPGSGYELNVRCAEPSDCSFASGLTVESIAAQSAYLTWGYVPGMPDLPTEYELEIEKVLTEDDDESDAMIRTYTTNNTYFMVSDLEPTTSYIARVRSICGVDRSPIFEAENFTTRCLLGGETQIGEGAEITTEEVPVQGCYEYSYTQQIYLASELNGAGEITGIAFELTEGTGDDTRDIVVYIGHTDSTSFDSETDELSIANMTVVYDDSYEFLEGWNEIEFDDSFNYNGTSNIVIAIDDNTGYYNCSPIFSAHSTLDYMTLTSSIDGTNINPADSNAFMNYGYTMNYRNNIKFIMPCEEDAPTCIAPNVAIVEVGIDQIKAIWAQGYTETTWKVEYKMSDDTLWTLAAASITDTFYTLTGLMDDTEYDIRVSSNCGTESLGTIRTAITLCTPFGIPFTEDFETWQASSSPSATYNRCFTRLNNYQYQTTVYPYVSTSYAHTGSKGMYMYSTNTFYSALVLPQLTVPLDSLELSFYMRISTASHYLVVGVVTDKNDIGTFVAIDTVSPSTLNVWELFEIPFNTYTGADGYITFLSPDGVSSYPYIDDIYVDYIPSCPHVSDIRDSVTFATYSIIDWNDPSTATEWEIEYGPVGFTPGTGVGTSVITTVRPYTLQNLTPATHYDVYVRGICAPGDSARWWNGSILTRPCDDPMDYTVYRDTVYTGAYLPMHTYYNYSYTQQIYLPSDVDTLGGGNEIEINSIAFQYTLAEEITRKNVRIFLGHTSDSSFATTTSWIADSTLQQVYFGDITWNNSGTDYWFEIILDTAFTYNGTDNLVLAVFDSTRTYINSSNKFRFIKNTGDFKTLYKYQDTPVMDRANLPAGTRYEYRNTVKFVSCGGGCPKPTGVTVEPVSTTAVLSWTNVGNYEVSYKEPVSADWSDPVEALNTNTFTVTGLMPETEYEFRVRQICDSTMFSSWAVVTGTTIALPCMAPVDFSTSNVAFTSATVAWVDSLQNQEAWVVAYGYGNDASAWDTLETTTPSIDLAGLYSNTEYTVYVKAYCSVSADIYADWSAPFTFRTASCEGVTNVVANDITAEGATISWTAPAGQTKWEISYGLEGVLEDNGNKRIVENTPVYTITGLESEFTYDVYVRSICQDGVYSAWSTKAQFRTTREGINTASADNVKVQIYPNPANSEATVTVDGITGEAEFVLADMNGRIIVTETINCEGSLVKTINVRNLAKGAYFVHIYNNDFNTTRKLIVK